MGVRWNATVIDCRDTAAQGRWWAEVLGWQIAYEDSDEVAIVPPHAMTARAESIPVEERGPGLVFVTVPEGKSVKNRLHIDVAPGAGGDQQAEVDRLVSLGASRVDVGQPADATFVVMADPEANEFCVLSPRD